MTKTRRNIDAVLKAKIALEALRGKGAPPPGWIGLSRDSPASKSDDAWTIFLILRYGLSLSANSA